MPSGTANGLAPCHARNRLREIERRFMGIKEHVSMKCLWFDLLGVDTRHACICPRAGAEVNQHQPLLLVI